MNKISIIATVLAAVVTTNAATITFTDVRGRLSAGVGSNDERWDASVASAPSLKSQTLELNADTDTPIGHVILESHLAYVVSDQGFSAELSRDLKYTPQSVTGGGSGGVDIHFTVDALTAFTVTASWALDTERDGSYSISLQDSFGKIFDVYQNVFPPTVGTHTYTYEGFLGPGPTYRLQWASGALGDQTYLSSLDFRLTDAPVPEPQSYALAAGLGLLAFGAWSSRR